MRKFIIGLLIIFAGIIAYVLILANNHNKVETGPTDITIGWIGTLTGPSNMIGVDNLNAVKLAVEEYQLTKGEKDPNVKLLMADDQYKNEITLLKYKQMMSEIPRPAAIFIGTYSGLKTVAPYAARDSVILIDPIDNDKKISTLNSNVFLIAKETESLAGVISNAITDQGKQNIAIVFYSDSDDFMRTLAFITREILKNNGINVHMYEYKASIKDFRSLLEKAKNEKVDGYLFLGYQEIGSAMKQAREMEIKAPFYSINVIPDPILQQNSEGAVNGTYLSHFTLLDGNRVETDEFMNKYFKMFHKKPLLEWTAMQGYDAATILLSAIKAASLQKGDFIDNLRTELLSTSNFEGVSGNITILPSGASRGIYPRLYIFQNGKIVPAQ